MAAERTPPPVIGKAGSYTVFITPPPNLTPSEGPISPIASPTPSLSASTPEKEAPLPAKSSPRPTPPPVQVPPQQFEKPAAKSSGSVFGFFWDAIVKVQNAHSSLDEYLADWFGLNQSRYQWALNDYYESSEKVAVLFAFVVKFRNVLLVGDGLKEKESGKVGKPKELSSKAQAV
ncbi:wiskott-Aldrich syndrome protein family member 2 [Musa troglodytarum]|uniref:Wiskott-Aldrich syndrome protein family member 2 n=1 Tax=Musa troglodytarum TaxID=320322 RepID=A0A9E7KVP7_9LILI|nr:wiskott-Aldrich syndrome protein family member 2 [Musa troglodytarum]URE33895.1 wiskott-Aldrich syndrome protein family member 2 [Musa troglodytarum]